MHRMSLKTDSLVPILFVREQEISSHDAVAICPGPSGANQVNVGHDLANLSQDSNAEKGRTTARPACCGR